MSESPEYQKIKEGAASIYQLFYQALQTHQGCLIGRNGTIELQTILFYSTQYQNHIPFPNHLMKTLELHAGIFPATPISVKKWCIEYTNAMSMCDGIAAGWYAPLKKQEADLLNIHNPRAVQMPLRSLEPYYVEPDFRWTRILENQKVAIVNAFAQTAFQQTSHVDEIWPGGMSDSLFPPGITWIPIVTGYAPVLAQGRAEWDMPVSSWEDAVNETVHRVLQSGARIALIGCGGLGMILGKKLKENNILAIVLGGALQVLFGIKGGRWANHPVLRRFWNDSWVWPSEQETPRASLSIEHSCYWNPQTKN
jgi:hypothetical protein